VLRYSTEELIDDSWIFAHAKAKAKAKAYAYAYALFPMPNALCA